MIVVLATIELNTGCRDEFLKEFHGIVPEVCAEDGCLEYFPAVDIPSGLPAQPGVRADTVTVVEKWRDLAALEAHLRAPHMLAYRERVKAYVRSVSLAVLEPA